MYNPFFLSFFSIKAKVSQDDLRFLSSKDHSLSAHWSPRGFCSGTPLKCSGHMSFLLEYFLSHVTLGFFAGPLLRPWGRQGSEPLSSPSKTNCPLVHPGPMDSPLGSLAWGKSWHLWGWQRAKIWAWRWHVTSCPVLGELKQRTGGLGACSIALRESGGAGSLVRS